MWLKDLLQCLTATSSRRRPARRRPPAARLCLEPLERRDVPSYVYTDLGTLGGGRSQANDLNASGQVVGWSTLTNGSTHAFLWQNGVMTDLGTLGVDFSEALAINDAGQVVGRSAAGDNAYHAFLLTPEDTDANGAPDRWFRDGNSDGRNDLMLDLGPNSIANAVNNAGQVVGVSWWDTSDGAVFHAFSWQNGVMTDLGTLGGSSSSASAINDASQVTGFVTTETGLRSAFLWQGGGAHDIGASPSEGNAINESGQIAGVGRPSWMYGATLWTPTTPNGTTGSFAFLGVLPPHYQVDSHSYMGFSSTATDVNDLGSVVGTSTVTYEGGDSDVGYNFESSRAFLWSDGVMQELDSALGVQLYNATAINNAGQIVANGEPGWQYPWNEAAYCAYLLTPVSGAMPFVTIDDVTITEGNSGTRTASFTVTLSASSSQPVTVAYATADATATAGSDYQAASGTLTFAPREISKAVTVVVKGDRLAEPDETFVVHLSGATHGFITDGQGVGTIADDEPRISISDVTNYEGKKGKTTLFTFTVTLSAAYDQAVTMSFRTADGTATTRDQDYVGKSGTLTFAPGETTKTITIEVKGDSKKEADETFCLDLFGLSSNALFAKGRGIGTILNDD
jgi:probable HAF family extracellular repeat protein